MTKEQIIERAKKIQFSSNPKDYIQFVGEILDDEQESEDERIRKELVNFLQSPFIKENLTDEKVAPWVAYLEKQKEQKPKDVEEKYLDGIKRDWFERGKKEVLTVPELYGLRKQNEQSLGDFINDFPYSDQKEQKPAEWSEEDEKTIDDAYCWLCEYAGSLIQRNYGKSSMLYGIANKLKSLRPSWKPSEQEKGALRTAIHILTDERSFPKAAAHLQDILNAFEGKESRKDWKPTEEQMDILSQAAEAFSLEDNEEDAETLASLYNDLKKLM